MQCSTCEQKHEVFSPRLQSQWQPTMAPLPLANQGPVGSCRPAHQTLAHRHPPCIGPQTHSRAPTSLASQPCQHEDAPSCSGRLDEQELRKGVSAVVTAAGASVLLSSLLCPPAKAEEIPWRPRRHYRRLDEPRDKDWAYKIAAEQEKDYDRAAAEKRRAEQLRREQEQAETARRRVEEEARRKKAQEILAKEAAAVRNADRAFSIKVGGTEISPFIIWGGIAFLLYGSLRGLMAAGNAISGRQGRGKGKWVYDRSLGGKKVWVPEDAADGGAPASGRPVLSDRDLDRLTAVAAAAANLAPTAGTAAGTPFAIPSWWNPGPRFVPDASVRAGRQADADRLLGRIELSKNKGEDYAVADLIKLREICQEGSVTVRPRTVGSRDAMYRAAVDATVSYALDSLDSGVDLGGQEPTRFLSALAGDLGMPEEKAVAAVCSAVAAATRSRLISALAAIKSSGSGGPGETEAVMALIRLVDLITKLPVLGVDSTEVALIAESLERKFTVEERQRVFYLLGQLYPEAAALHARLLAFDPRLVVPQLLKDMEEWRRQQGEQAASAVSQQ